MSRLGATPSTVVESPRSNISHLKLPPKKDYSMGRGPRNNLDEWLTEEIIKGINERPGRPTSGLRHEEAKEREP